MGATVQMIVLEHSGGHRSPPTQRSERMGPLPSYSISANIYVLAGRPAHILWSSLLLETQVVGGRALARVCGTDHNQIWRL